ncbi:MAG: SDR family oxidoreductase [Planctomycetes bacterium]|nr:SDR family oxidoreductase [Planctomycetota bacterium]
MLSARSILVTGGSRGIGLATARALVAGPRRELALVLAARDGESLEHARLEVERVGVGHGPLRICTVEMDVGDAASVATGMQAAAEFCGPLDGLVLSAGVAESAPLHKTGDDLLERMLAVNLWGAFRPLRAALPDMVARGFGRVVVVGSIASLAGAGYVAAYTASKHAVLGLVRAAAVEYGGKGVTVNAVCPGYVDTDMTRRSLARIAGKTGLSAEQALDRILARVPMRRLVRPEEVAASILFLMSEAAAAVNGTALTLDGGELAG